MKLHLGAGNDIKTGWINHDLVPLSGIDKTHDLSVFPWPWESHSIDEVVAKDVLEHLPNLIKVMEEIHRICKPGAKIHLSVPYWNSFEAVTDPTHCQQFNEFTFEFFDPSTKRCQRRPYYTNARFQIENIFFGIKPFSPYLRIPFLSQYYIIKNKYLRNFVGFLASYYCNIIIGLEVYLVRK